MILQSIPELKSKNDKFESGTGSLTKESFTFVSQLGSGAFGKVYKVSSKLTNNIYALKVLSKNQINNLKLNDQLKNEITILARCDHDNIIQLFGTFEDKNYIYLIMELATDATLFSKLKKTRKVAEPLAAAYITDVTKALIYLHSQTPVIIHRDLKPENVLVSNGRCKIADFGWSNVDDEFRNTFCGTPDYLAPEMIVGSGHNDKLDVWTVGILLYELLHGQPPFSPKDKIPDARLMQKAIEKNILSGQVDFDPAVSPEARAAVKAMLNPKDSLRPSAKGILELDFFKKYAKKVEPAPVAKPGVQPKANVDSLDATALKARIKEYETRLETLLTTNKGMGEVLENRETVVKTQKSEIDSLTSKNAELEKEVKALKSSGGKALDAKYSTNGSTNSNSNASTDVLAGELKRAKADAAKHEETVNYLFKRTKQLSTLVLDFYHKVVTEQTSVPPQEQNINYENTLTKLETIFREYEKYKLSATGKRFDFFAESNRRIEPERRNTAPNNLLTPPSSAKLRAFSPLQEQTTTSTRETVAGSDKNITENQKAIHSYFLKTDPRR